MISKEEFFRLQDLAFADPDGSDSTPFESDSTKSVSRISASRDVPSDLERLSAVSTTSQQHDSQGARQEILKEVVAAREDMQSALEDHVSVTQVSSISDIPKTHKVLERLPTALKVLPALPTKRKADEMITSTAKQPPAIKIEHRTRSALSSDAPSSSSPTGHNFNITGIFTGLVFYFVPNSRNNLARNLRMKKVEQLGGKIVSQFDTATITHLVVDKNLNSSIVNRIIGRESIPRSIAIFNEFWTPDCVVYGKLMDHSAKYSVPGMESRGPPIAPIFPPLARRTSSQSQSDAEERSLQIKNPPENKYNIVADTPEDEDNVLSLTSFSPTVAFLESSATTTSFVPKTSRPSDELDEALRVVHNLGDVLLEEESEFDEDIDNEDQSKWQAKFKCMMPHLKSSSGVAGPNDFVIQKLQIMQDYYEISRDPGDKWKPRGYRLAISTLRQQDQSITTYTDAIRVPHIGDRLAKHIVEIARTGTLERADSLGDDYQLVQKFIGIYGVGPARANEFVKQGLRSFADILERANPSKNQRIGIDLYDDLNTRIPRSEVYQHKKLVDHEAAKFDKMLQIYVMGSYRRGSSDCGDIDIMLTRRATPTSELVELWQKLLKVLFGQIGYLTHSLIVSSTKDGLKWQGICKLPGPDKLYRRIDFLLVPWQQRGPALLYFTGNDLFNRSMRLLARKKGYTLNEKALMKGAMRTAESGKITQGQNTGAETEEQIFKILGVPFRRPEERCIS